MRRSRRARERKAKYLGKAGALTELLKALGKLGAAERPAAGARINDVKAKLEAGARRAAATRSPTRSSRSSSPADALDVSLPGRGRGTGGLHPITRTLERIETLFRSLGFEVADGPEIEDDFHNFTALNTPENHPARSMHDTFYVEGGRVLRTHTSTCRCATWKRTRRRSRSSRRAASIASTATRRTRRCSTRSKACGSTRT